MGVWNGKKVFTKSRHADRECFRCGRICHIRADCRAKTHINGGSPKSAPKWKSVGNCEDEETETSQNVPLETIDLGSPEVLSDHGDAVDDDESKNETTEIMPPGYAWTRPNTTTPQRPDRHTITSRSLARRCAHQCFRLTALRTICTYFLNCETVCDDMSRMFAVLANIFSCQQHQFFFSL